MPLFRACHALSEERSLRFLYASALLSCGALVWLLLK
jgi:hypothetical protein